MFSRLQPGIRAIAGIHKLQYHQLATKNQPFVAKKDTDRLSFGIPQTRHYAAHSQPHGKCSTPFSVKSHSDIRNVHEQFMSIFPTVVNDLAKYVASHDSAYASHHIIKTLEYNVPHGKLIRSLTYILACKQMLEANDIRSSNLHLAFIIGWCVELLQATILMVDDIIDESEMRRNQLCWYRMENVGRLAVNDAVLIENGAFYILKKYASQLPHYTEIVELFHETAMVTAIGQLMDMKLVSGGVSQFTMPLHKSLTNAKTSHFAFYFPIALATLSHGQYERDELNGIKRICNDIGHFYQVQNDYFDCFGDVDVMKKPGSDIAEGKCTWLANKCLEIGSNVDRAVLDECYGRNDSNSIEHVRQIYEDLELPALYCQYEAETYDGIRGEINNIPSNSIRLILLDTLNRTFNRKTS